MSNTDTDALVRKLRYMGRQYAAGQVSRGGSPRKHYLEEAADTIERLTRERDEAVAREREPDREAAIKAITAKWMTRQFGQHAGYLHASEIVDIVLANAIRTTKATT